MSYCNCIGYGHPGCCLTRWPGHYATPRDYPFGFYKAAQSNKDFTFENEVNIDKEKQAHDLIFQLEKRVNELERQNYHFAVWKQNYLKIQEKEKSLLNDKINELEIKRQLDEEWRIHNVQTFNAQFDMLEEKERNNGESIEHFYQIKHEIYKRLEDIERELKSI